MATVMVMDEDEPSRALLVEWLAAAGHRVLDGPPGKIDGGESVDLVLIDLPRPRALGVALIGRVRLAQPAAALLGLSTQLRESLPPGSPLVRELGLRRLLAKPCSRLELLDAAEQSLAAGTD